MVYFLSLYNCYCFLATVLNLIFVAISTKFAHYHPGNSTIFKVYGMIRPRIEPGLPEAEAVIVTTRPTELVICPQSFYEIVVDEVMQVSSKHLKQLFLALFLRENFN